MANFHKAAQLALRFSNPNILQTRLLHRCCCTSGAGPSNKPPEVVPNQRTYNYLVEHTAEEEALRKLRHTTYAEWPTAKQMQVSPEQGRYISWLVATMGATRAIEVGVFTGYSAICIAKALGEGGKLVACESDERPLDTARAAFEAAGVSCKIDLQVGKGMATLQSLLDDGQQESFDFAFVDADKRGYTAYHELLLKLLRPGGVVVYDNMLWYGAVADPQDERKTTVAIREFGDQLMGDRRVDCSLVAVGDGMALCRRLQ